MLKTIENLQNFLAWASPSVWQGEYKLDMIKANEMSEFLSKLQGLEGFNPESGQQLARLRDFRDRWLGHAQETLDKRDEAIRMIDSLTDPVKTIVRMRIVERKEWLDICDAIGYCRTQASRIYKQGLEEILARQTC